MISWKKIILNNMFIIALWFHGSLSKETFHNNITCEIEEQSVFPWSIKFLRVMMMVNYPLVCLLSIGQKF